MDYREAMGENSTEEVVLCKRCKELEEEINRLKGTSVNQSDYGPKAAVKKWWNEKVATAEIPKLISISSGRWDKFKQRHQEGMWESREAIASAVKNSSFLKGEDAKWRITFDWLITNSTNWIKVVEGNYNDSIDIAEEQRLMAILGDDS